MKQEQGPLLRRLQVGLKIMMLRVLFIMKEHKENQHIQIIKKEKKGKNYSEEKHMQILMILIM